MSLLDEMLAIRSKRGALSPRLVLEEATPRMHPLHSRFEWDNKKAGDAYRLRQAHELIQECRISQTRADGSKLTLRAFQAVRSAPQTYVYEPSEEVAKDPFLRSLVLQEMEREWKQMEQRYQDFAEFWELVKGSARKRARKAS
jgi:selenocysteine lyase/cysteine desulfurase